MGFGIMPGWLVEAVTKLMVNSNSCTASFTQRAGIAALDGPQDAVEGLGKEDGAACPASLRCGDPAATTILFPGNPGCAGGRGCERVLAGADIYIPPTNGKPWGETFALGTDAPEVIAGYSSGRHALLRRLAFGDDGMHAVLLDPSWEDGARDFLGDGPRHGEDIVHDWLARDPDRTFLLVYSTKSVGWKGYAALQATDVGDRVRVCSVTVLHGQVPSVPKLHDALVDPDAWDNGRCR
jgi:hypothetical protein